MSEVVGGAAEGAAQGAVIGSVIPGVGTAVGAVVGGVVGAVKGLFSSKSSAYKRKAAGEQRKGIDLEQAIVRRDIVMAGYAARAQQVARAASVDEGGGLRSSAPLGAISSTRRQLGTNVDVFDKGTGYRRRHDKFMKKAGKYAGYAATTGSLMSAASMYAGAFGGGSQAWWKSPSATSAVGPTSLPPVGVQATRSIPTYGYKG
jgi:hypothetical protein